MSEHKSKIKINNIQEIHTSKEELFQSKKKVEFGTKENIEVLYKLYLTLLTYIKL